MLNCDKSCNFKCILFYVLFPIVEDKHICKLDLPLSASEVITKDAGDDFSL